MAAIDASMMEDFPAWYQEVLTKAQLADTGPTRGTIVIRPYAYSIWELLQGELDRRIKRTGAENAYFPMLIPESYLHREAEHVEGFAPELAVVTQAGGKELTEKLVVRPTSETVFGEYMAKWIGSHRDLPLLLNQWANVVRWELRPRAFLRTTEFLWQEGHTAHATADEATAFARRILEDVYREVLVEILAIPVIAGVKTAGERFAGAVNTLTCEGMMRDGKALQLSTSHELGTNFSSAFNIRYAGTNGAQTLTSTTSWGASTRMLGGLFMAHGDQSGLRIPPRIAPIQVVLVQIGQGAPAEVVDRIDAELRALGIRSRVDRSIERSIGMRATDWDLKGVPVQVQIGQRDLDNGVVTLVDRVAGIKGTVSLETVVTSMAARLEAQQRELYDQALQHRRDRTQDVRTIDEAIAQSGVGFARIPWADLGPEGEAALQKHGLTVRCLTDDVEGVPENLDEAFAIIARAY